MVVKKRTKKSRSPYKIRLEKETEKFWNFKFTIQSVYWILIGVSIVATAIINFNNSVQINNLLNDISSNYDTEPVLETQKSQHKKDKDY